MIETSQHNTIAPPSLRPTRFEDYPQIQRLESFHGLLTLSTEDWQAIWRDNPVRISLGEAWPIGWVLEDQAGQIVGSLANIPTRYTFRGRDLIAATGRAWVVAPEYRGVALWLMDEYFNQDRADLFINTTVNALAVDAFSAFGSSRIPLGDWETASFWITHYPGFARTALGIKKVPLAPALAPLAAVALRLKDAVTVRALPKPASSINVAQSGGFDTRFETFWKELVRQNPNKLLAARDTATLTWHFAGPLRAGQAWIFTASRNNLLRAYCILKRQDHPPSGLTRMRLVDYQSIDSQTDLLPPLLQAALDRCVREKVHTLEHVGRGLPRMKTVDDFAPYRRKLLSWPFYYHAADPTLRAQLAKPEAWDPSTFDGDASL